MNKNLRNLAGAVLLVKERRGMKVKRFVCLFVCLFVTSTATTVLAQQGQYSSKGDSEWGFQGSYNNISVDDGDESVNVDFFYADLNASKFLTDDFSVGISTVWFYLPEIETIEAYALGLEANARYHFQQKPNFVPYVGAHAGYYYARAESDGESESDNITSYGFHGGFKVPINDNVYFDTQLKWTDYDIPFDDLDLSALQVLLGLKIRFH